MENLNDEIFRSSFEPVKVKPTTWGDRIELLGYFTSAATLLTAAVAVGAIPLLHLGIGGVVLAGVQYYANNVQAKKFRDYFAHAPESDIATTERAVFLSDCVRRISDCMGVKDAPKLKFLADPDAKPSKKVGRLIGTTHEMIANNGENLRDMCLTTSKHIMPGSSFLTIMNDKEAIAILARQAADKACRIKDCISMARYPADLAFFGILSSLATQVFSSGPSAKVFCGIVALKFGLRVFGCLTDQKIQGGKPVTLAKKMLNTEAPTYHLAQMGITGVGFALFGALTGNYLLPATWLAYKAISLCNAMGDACIFRSALYRVDRTAVRATGLGEAFMSGLDKAACVQKAQLIESGEGPLLSDKQMHPLNRFLTRVKVRHLDAFPTLEDRKAMIKREMLMSELKTGAHL